MNAKASDSEPERKKIHAKFIRRNVPKAFITVYAVSEMKYQPKKISK